MTMQKFINVFIALALAATMQAQQPESVEYFLDTDPGYGKANIISNLHAGENQLTFDLGNATSGAHVLYVRSQDSDGNWSATTSRPIFIERLQDIVYVEFFIDSDPGVGKATPIALPDIESKAHLQLDMEVSTYSLSPGEHELFVRAHDVYGQWTNVMSSRFTVVEPGDTPVDGDLASLEYFFDTDPGYGNGFQLENASTGTNTYLMSFDSVEQGAHMLYLRAKDNAGNWSTTASRPLYIVNPQGLSAFEYFIDTDPGEGNASGVSIPDDYSDVLSFDVPTNDLPDGRHQFNVRAKGLDDLWSLVKSEPFTIETNNGITSVTWSFPITVNAEGGMITLVSDSERSTAGSRVSIYSLSGKKVFSAVWSATAKEFAAPLPPNSGSSFLVEVSDVHLGRVVEKIIVK